MNTAFLTEVFSAVIANSWRATCLIVLVLILRVLVRGRIPAQVWFFVWIVLGLRLVIPMSVSTEWSPYNFAKTRGAETAITTVSVSPAISSDASHVPTNVSEMSLPRPNDPEIPVVSSLEPTARIIGRDRWKNLAAFAWVTGFVALLSVRGFAWWRFRRQLHQALAADARVRTMASAEHGSVICLETEAVAAPALYGFVRPRLLFPPRFASQLSDAELRFVVRHELAHWRRRDLLAQGLMQMAVAVQWFNPFAWLAARLARADCELACDEFVLRGERAGESHAYGAALLKVLGVMRGGRRAIAVIGIVESRRQLADRVQRIAGYRAPTAGRFFAGIVLIALLAMVSITRESHAEVAADAATGPDGNAQSAARAEPAARESSRAPIEAQEELRRVVDSQQKKVNQAAREIQSFKERNGTVSLEERHRLLADTISRSNAELQRANVVFSAAEIRLNQMRETRANGGDLTALPFVASQPLIAALKEQLATQRIELVKLGERYRAPSATGKGHPVMIEARNKLSAIERELARAIDLIGRQLESEHEAAGRELELRRTELERAKQESLDLDRKAVELSKLERQYGTQNQILHSIAERAREVKTASPNNSAETDHSFQVSVVGAVNTQSAVTLAVRDNPIVLDAIARAGGFASNADRGAVRMIRAKPDGSRETITLTESVVMNGTDPAARLQRGDVIVVPEMPPVVPRFATVTGAVNSAGQFELPASRKMNIIDLLAVAGGPSRIADLKRVSVTRIDPQTQGKKVLTINVDDFVRGRSGPNANWSEIVVEPGDSIFVPERIL
jgi:beta-lactamase regulating signal transducer with metallopeptidase domain/protein involved in polysaccharide export with SLBB domain